MAKKLKRGRPRAIGKWERKIILRAMKRGDSRAGAAAAAGVSLDSIRRELQRNPQFLLAVKRARVAGKQRILANLYREAGKEGNGELALKVLRHRYPEEWSERRLLKKPPAITNVSTNVTIAVEHRDTLLALAARLGARDVFDEAAIARPAAINPPPVGISSGNPAPAGTAADAAGPDAAAE